MADLLRELSVLRTPERIQDFLDALPINHEKRGETCYSPLTVLKERKAHCLEGALLAAAAFALTGERPLIMNLQTARGDDDHAVALVRRHGYWGAVSKTNHAVLRYRDPVYRTLRELALSYFHEYFLGSNGTKTLRAYSRPLDLRRYGTDWMRSVDDLWPIAYALADAPHTPIVPPHMLRKTRSATPFERRMMDHAEWVPEDPRT